MNESRPSSSSREFQHLIFEPIPREIGIEDVESIQECMQYIHDLSISDNADYVPSDGILYKALIESQAETIGTEPKVSEHSFDKTVSTLLAAWGEQNGLSGRPPQTLSETIDIFTKNYKLNEQSPIYFQGGAEYATSGNFVHIITGRAMGNKPREDTTRRYYLNPRADKMGHVVEQLTEAALQTEIPLYFKFINFATGKPDKHTFTRNDRVVIYASDNQVALVEDVLKGIILDDSTVFSNRKIAGFGEILTEGISRTDAITTEQNEIFKGYSESISFNQLRSMLIFEVTMNVTKDLICIPAYGSHKIGDQTIRQKFASELSKEVSKRQSGIIIKDDDPLLQESIRLSLKTESLKASGKFSGGAISMIQNSVSRIARDVLPRIQSDSLLHGYQYYIKQLAPKYGIDPDNLAKNIPILT